MTRSPAPTIVQCAERLLAEIEQAASLFPKRHKHTHGEDVRRAAMRVARCAHRAWRDTDGSGGWRQRLVWAIDDLKILLQLGRRIQAYRSRKQFVPIARLALDVGRQAGGWLREEQRRKSQNREAASPPCECAQTLSTRAASVYEAQR